MAAMVESAVRVPTPDPSDAANSPSPPRRPPSTSPPAQRRRARSYSRSPPPPNGRHPRDVDKDRAKERDRQLEMRMRDEAKPAKPLTDAEKQALAKAEYERLLNMRSGGTYIPPARLKALQAQITDKTSKEYQRMAWEALKKSINGLINKVNVSNIKHIVPELFNENLIRGRGLFCRSIMKAQAASPPFTPIYAAMAAIVNTKLPQVGELLINRLIIQFRKAFKRNDKSVCNSSTAFMAHLINQQVAHEMLAAQILLLLLHKPSDDSVEIAVGLMKEVGQHIEEMNSQIALAVYDQFRSILHEADIDKRVQYMIEVLFQIRKDKYKDNLAVREELDLVEEEDQITHRPGLDDQLVAEDGLNIFKFDPDFEANEEAYRKLKAEILGDESGSDDASGDGDGDSDESSEDEEEAAAEKAVEIKDQSNADLVNLRRSIYLTIMSSGGFEEACHKLMRINLPAGREDELPSMLIECCSQEKTYTKFFGLIGERFCKLNRLWKDLFEGMFTKYYETIHRYETNRLRIIAQFFGHLLATDAIGWQVLQVIQLTEEDTTSSSRIFIKILIEDLAQGVGMKTVVERFKDDSLQSALTGMFPTDHPKNIRFSINFFTAIGMGVLTEGMREWLNNMPKPAPAALPPAKSPDPSDRSRSESVSSYSSYSSYSSGSNSRSDSGSRRRDGRERSRSRSRTPPRRRGRRQSSSASRDRPHRRDGRGRSHDSRSDASSRSSSRSPPRRRRDSESRSPPRRDNASLSRSSPRRTNRDLRSLSRSRDPPPVRRGRSQTRSVTHSDQDSPPPRGRPARGKRARSMSSYDSRSRSPPQRSPPPKRRRSSISQGRSISRSPPRRATFERDNGPKSYRRERSASMSRSPPRREARASDKAPKTNGRPPAAMGKPPEDDMSHIHPSRRGLMGASRR